MRKLVHKLFLVTLFLGALFFSFQTTHYSILTTHPAYALEVGVNVVQREIILPSTDIRILLAKIIRAAFGLLGIVAVGIILWGGFQWMTSGGEDDKIGNAKKTLINGVIGLIIMLSAVAITQFVLNALIAATSGPSIGGGGGISGGITPRSGGLGRVIDMHYPPRGAVDVPRNTNILITFKNPIRISSIIDGYDDRGTPADLTDDAATDRLNVNAVKIFKAIEGAERAFGATDVKVRVTPDRKTFIFDPVALLGSGSENILYTVDLSGEGARLEKGDLAFTGVDGAGYAWQFETGTFVDLTPPILTDFFPFPENRPSPPHPTASYERNVLIQINFNEAIDPTSIVNPGNITVRAGEGNVPGLWAIANQYRSAEFVPTTACGTNSCGETMYCLPANAEIRVTIRAAKLTDDPDDGPVAALPANGVADVASNSLNDRGTNAEAEGSPADDVNFKFNTSDQTDITGPTIVDIAPNVLGSDIPQDAPVSVTFSEVMSRGSINTSSVSIVATPIHEMWYSLSSNNLNEAGDPVGSQDAPVRSRASVSHGLFLRAPIGATPQQGYVPAVLPGVRDAYQNCFVPSAGPGPVPNATCRGNPYCCNGVPSEVASCAGVGF